MLRFGFRPLALGAVFCAAAFVSNTSALPVAQAKVTAAPDDPAFKAGLADRRAWEEWFASLDGDFKVGAEYWAGQRHKAKPGSLCLRRVERWRVDGRLSCSATKVGWQ